MPRFVILEHQPSPRGGKPLHWDLMLEADEGLLTWALTREPDTSGDIPAEPLPLPRVAYLDYEGPVAGDRGTVSRWDAGTFTWQQRDDRVLVADLRGDRLQSTMTLNEPGDRQRCLVRFGDRAEASD